MQCRKAFAAIITLAVSGWIGAQPIQADWNIRDHMSHDEVIVQSHRGAGILAPENTREAFELGWSLNTYPEADVRTTTDGVIVAFHDKNFKRVVKNVTPELAEKGVEDLTWEEASKLSVGEEIEGKDFVGHRICTMDEIFELMAGKPERILYLDIKKVDLNDLANLVKKHRIENQVIFATQHHDMIVDWKKLIPESKTLLWVPCRTEADQKERFEAAKARNFEGITQVQIHTHVEDPVEDINRSSVNPFRPSDQFLVEAGQELRRRNILFQTLPYGGTTREVYWKLLDLGLMSFATDVPEVTRTAIRDYYELPPTPKAQTTATVSRTSNTQ